MDAKNDNRFKSNEQLFAEYFVIIKNSYSPPYFTEAFRLINQYGKYLAGSAPSIQNFPEFFLRYLDLKPNTRARYHNAFSAFFKWFSAEATSKLIGEPL